MKNGGINEENPKTLERILFGVFIITAVLLCCLASTIHSSTLNDAEPAEQKNYVFLSDLDYITDNNWSYNGWSGHTIQKDHNQEGGSLSVIVDGEKRMYAKGLSVHARGQVTFDISEYSTDFPRFIAKLGVDASRGTKGSIWFQIYASNDGSTWTSLLKTATLTGASNCVEIDLNIEGYQYLRIYVDPAGNNDSDHGTIADARLVSEDFVVNDAPCERIHRVEYYDEILGQYDLEYNYNNNYKLILERELVNKLGFWNIQYSAGIEPYLQDTLEWILDETRVLEEVIEVGEISDGSKFLKVLSELHHKYKNELTTENGYVYEKMMVGLAAAYSTDRVISPLAFSFQAATYDYMERFDIMKQLFDNNELRRVKTNALAGELVPNEWFKNYHVQLMRMVMQDGTSNVDLVWLNGYTNEKQSFNYHMIPYISPNYNQARFYDEANRELYDTKYYLSKYNVPYGERIARYWMVIEGGGICWNASRFAQSMHRVNGIPATGAYQPGHELYIHYYEDSNGNGYWTPRYGNWGSAGSTWGGANPYRYIFNWGNKYFADKHISGSKGASNTGYLYLAQANLNRYEEYKKSLYYNLTANSYTNNEQKLETYFKALEVNNLNLDTYDSIITLYKNMSVQNEGGTITSHDWYNLANKIIDAYNYYPVAMCDLLKVIRPYLESSEKLDIDRLEKEALTRASRATANETIQVDGVRTHANQLLNKTQPDPVSFSFDGDDAGKIVLNPMYSLAWGYSLDGGQTFTEYTTDDSVALTPEELANITAENDIIVNFMGLSYTFRIDITEGTLSNLLFANDLENRVVGVDLTYEWRNSENDSWTSYKDASPDNTGDKTLYVRRSSSGTQLASNSVTYTFTADNQPYTRKYVPVSHLSIEAYSTQSVDSSRPFYAPNAIDGNGNTLWHTDFRENVLNSDVKPYITIKLDKPRYISALEFKQLQYRSVDPHFIKNARIYVSEDGENWIEAGKIENCPQDNELRDITFEESIYGEYVKIEMDTYNMFASLSLVNIFQDLTKNPRPTAGIGYSTTDPTTGNVIARLVNISVENYEILTSGGDTHEFIENGEFTFRFRDLNTGLEGSALAKVDWIDRTAPTATIEYSTTSKTNGNVRAVLIPNEEIEITNRNSDITVNEDGQLVDSEGNILEGYTVDSEGNVTDASGYYVMNINPFIYDFIYNDEFTFEFRDKAGNTGTATAKVDWIDREPPEATLSYSQQSLTNQDVIVTIEFSEDAIVTNNNGSTTYTFDENGEFRFEFRDLAGNMNSITAHVDWIDKIAPTAELKYVHYEDKVIVKVVNPSEEIVFENGIGIYEFTQNGSYDIIFYDKAGNVGSLTAVIEGIKDSSNEEHPVNPTNPDNDSKNPNDTNKPGDNTSVNPSDKPTSSPTDESGSQPSINNSKNDSSEASNTVEPVNKDYKKFTAKNVHVEITLDSIHEDLELIVEPFTLPDSLAEIFGEDAVYYDIYMVNSASKRVNINSTSPIKISIKVKNPESVIGVYNVADDNRMESIDFEINGDYIEIVTNSLGKYVISYNEVDISEIEMPTSINEKNLALAVIIIISCTLVIGLFIYFIIKLNKK